MKFSLITPPTDAPSRIPLTRGLPSASALQVDTGALPRALPLPEMNVEAAAAPYQAMARFAAAGGEVSEQVSNLILAAEAKKREADNLAVSNSIYAKTSEEVDTKFEALKTSTDHNGLRPAFNEMWKAVTRDAVAGAPNKDVSRSLQIKLDGLRTVKAAEVSDAVRKKTIDYHEAQLDSTSRGIGRLITDPNTTEAERDFHVKNLENYYLGYAKILPVDRIERVRERTFTSSYNTLAQQEMLKDPAAFQSKSEGGQDGWRKFANDGKYPADPKYLTQLVDVHAPARVLANERRNDELSRRREAYNDAHLTSAWQQDFKQLLADFYSDDPARVGAASSRLDESIHLAGPYWKNGEAETLLRSRRDTARQGGTTVPAIFDKLQTDLLRDPSKVSREHILTWAHQGLAVVGDRSVTSLLDKREQLLKGDDISQREDYKVGMRILEASPIGGGAILGAAAAFSSSAKMSDVYFVRDLHAKAIAEFDRLSRTPDWSGKSLRELGEFLTDKYTKLLYLGKTGGKSTDPVERK